MDREDIEYIESGELGHSTGDGSDAENMLSERIVRKGSRWQVQSEKGRNMGTYDTRKEAEDRLRDIEMFKHMKESGNHSVNESLQDEIERSLPVSDNYLDQSAQYILPDGRFLLLDDPDTGTAAYDDSSDSSGMHGDEFEYLRDAGLFGTWQEYAKYRDSQGWIEASDSHPEDDSCIRIAYIEPTEAQYRSIERFADHCLDSWGYIKVEIGRNQEFYRAFCLDDSYCPDYMDPSNEEVGNFTGYEIARRIRNYFHSVGNSSIAEDMISDGRHIVYRVGQVDDFRQGLFFADSLDYYNKSDVRYDKNDIKAYELDMSGARVFDPTREWGMNVYEWNDIRQGEKFLRDRGFFYYEYLDDIDYDDPDTYHEVMTDTDHLSQWAYENGYDAIIIRNTPNIGGNVDNLTEYCIFDKSLIKPLTQETKQDENYDINESMEGHEVDSEGNALSKDQSSYFRNSKVRDSSGHLKVVYHGTGSKFNSFSKGDVGFHFGTLGQAKAIAGDRDEGHVDAYYLNIGNPAEMYDFGPTGPYSILWWWKAQSFDDYGSIFGFDMTREELDKVNRVLGNMGEKTLDDIHTDADADKCDHEIRDMYNSPQSKLVRGLLGDRGYDGIVYTNNFEDVDTNINTGDISYIAFEPNQIKSVSNKTPTNSNNINESTEVSEKDNEGNVLSSEQVEFFRDSKIRTGMNGYGNLRVCYNGQPRDWGNEYRKLDTVQFKFKDKPNDFGFFFTNSRDTASKYAKNNPSSQNGGIVKSVYLNIVNPLVFKNMVCTRDDFLGELKDNNVDTGFDVKDSSRVRRRNVWEWIDLYGSELRKNIVKAGYDGVIFDEGWDKTIVAFNPNQIKSIDNKNPTNSNNINEDYEPDVYYRGYDSRYGVFDSDNQYGQLYTWVTDEPEYALEYAEHNEYGKVAKVRVTCEDRKIGGVSDLPDDADYYDPGDDIFREYILNNGLEGYGFTAGEYDDFCMCVSKDCVEVVDPDFKVGDEVDESLREGNRLTLDYNSIVKDELETLNKWLDKYDFRVELVDDYEFETHDVGMFLNTIQDDAYVFPIALNRDVIEEYCQGSTGMLVDAIEGTLWHEAGHGIYNFLQDSGCDMPPDEEECVEEFAKYVEDSVLYGILEDYMNTDEPLNESKADQQKFIGKFGQDVFDLFNKSRDRLRNNKVSTDILYHVKNTSVEDMKNILHNLQAKVRTGDNNVDLTKIQGKYNFLGSRDGYDVYEPLDVVASMSLGVGTGWCTTGRYGHAGDVNFKPSLKDAKEHWDEYTSEGVRFFYFLQNGIGKYALALYPKVFEVGEYIDRETYLKSCNFELYNQEDIPEYKGLSRIPYDLIGDDLVINTIVAQNGLILSEDGKKLMRAIKSISSCTIPDGVEEIKDMAFAYCTSLTSVTIPNSVKEIGVYAFDSCTSLTSINISNNVKEIGYSTFHGCTSLTSVMIPNGVDKIGVCAFWGCESLSSISIPNSVTRIDNRAFTYCKSLKSINIPEGVTIIQNGTFSDCTSLTNVNIPNSMKTISESAFENCTSLTSLIIPDSVNSIDDYAFIECPNLTIKTNNKYVINYCKDNDIPVEPLNEGLVESEINTDVSKQYQKDSGNLGEGYFEGDFNNVYDNMLQYESKEPALGPAFITRDGTFINLERFHGDIFGDIDDYEGEDFYTLEDNFGLIKLNGGNSYEPFPYVDLWTRPNEMQSRALVEWMYFLMERGKRKVLVNTPSSDRIYEFGKTLPEEILKDAFRDMGEQLQERVFDRGIDLGKYVLKYVRENLDDLIQSELDNVYNTYGFTEEDIENEIVRINSIHSAQDYIDYVGDGIDWIEDIVLKGLQDRFLDIVGYVEDKVYGLISSRDGMDCHLDVTHSFSPGDFPSHYLTVTKEVGDDIEERTIRIGDGHDNGRNDSDLEIDFKDMLDCPDYYDRDIEDLVADLDSSLGESLDSSVINEAKGDWEKFREWCGDDSIYNRFVRVQKRLAGKQRDIYYWMGLEKSLGKHGAMQELLAMLRDVESTPTKREREASARDGATLLYDSNGWKVYKIETLEASQKYGKDTTWCISGDGEGGNYDAADFWEGNEDQTYFFIHGDDKYALIWERGASDWDIWNAMDGKEPYVKGAPAVPGLPDISRPSPELLKGIAKCLGIPAGDILDIHVADYDDELSELFYDYDASGNYIVDTKGGTCYVIDTLGDFEDVTQDIEDALEEYDEE